MQSSSYSQFQNTCICTQNSVFYLVKMKVSKLIPKAILPTSSLHSSLVSFSRTSVQQISVLFLTSISPSPWSFPSGISIAHYHPLKQSSLNLVLLWLIALLLLRAKSSKSIIDFTVSASSLSLSLIYSKQALRWNSSYLYNLSLTKTSDQFLFTYLISQQYFKQLTSF